MRRTGAITPVYFRQRRQYVLKQRLLDIGGRRVVPFLTHDRFGRATQAIGRLDFEYDAIAEILGMRGPVHGAHIVKTRKADAPA